MQGYVRLNFDPCEPGRKLKWKRFFAVGWYDHESPLIDIYHQEKEYINQSNIIGQPLYLRGCRVGLMDKNAVIASFPFHKSDTSARGHVFTAVRSLTRSKMDKKRARRETGQDAGNAYNLFQEGDLDGNLIQHNNKGEKEAHRAVHWPSHTRLDHQTFFALHITLAAGTEDERDVHILFDHKEDMTKWLLFITAASSMKIPNSQPYVADLVHLMLAELESKFGNHAYFPFGSTYEHSVRGTDLLKWIVKHKWCDDATHGRRILQQMINKGCIVRCEKSAQPSLLHPSNSYATDGNREQFSTGIIYRVVELSDLRKKASGYLRKRGTNKHYLRRFFFFKGTDMFFWESKEDFDLKQPPLRNHPINLRGYQIQELEGLGFVLNPSHHDLGHRRVWEFQAECHLDKKDWIAKLTTILNEEMDEHIC